MLPHPPSVPRVSLCFCVPVSNLFTALGPCEPPLGTRLDGAGGGSVPELSLSYCVGPGLARGN